MQKHIAFNVNPLGRLCCDAMSKCWHCTLHCFGTKQLPTLTMLGQTRPRNGTGPAWPGLDGSHMIAPCRHKGTTVLQYTSTCPAAQVCGENCKTRGSAKPPFAVSGFASYSGLRMGSYRTAWNVLGAVAVCLKSKRPRPCALLRSITPSHKQRGLLGSTKAATLEVSGRPPAHAPVHQPARLRKVQAGRAPSCACHNLHPARSLSAHVPNSSAPCVDLVSSALPCHATHRPCRLNLRSLARLTASVI